MAKKRTARKAGSTRKKRACTKKPAEEAAQGEIALMVRPENLPEFIKARSPQSLVDFIKLKAVTREPHTVDDDSFPDCGFKQYPFDIDGRLIDNDFVPQAPKYGQPYRQIDWIDLANTLHEQQEARLAKERENRNYWKIKKPKWFMKFRKTSCYRKIRRAFGR